MLLSKHVSMQLIFYWRDEVPYATSVGNISGRCHVLGHSVRKSDTSTWRTETQPTSEFKT